MTAAAAESSLGVDYQAEILVQLNLMETLLTNMTDQLMEATQPTGEPPADPADEGGADSREEPESDALQQQQDALELLPHGRFLSRRDVQPPQPLPLRLTLEPRSVPLSAAGLPACSQDQLETLTQTLTDSAAVLDRVASGELTPDTETALEEQNSRLSTTLTTCSLSEIDGEEASSLLNTVEAVQTHLEAAQAAATPPEVGLEVSSAFMVVLITLSCLMGLVSLVGLTVLTYRYITVSKSSASPTKGNRGGGKNTQAGWAGRDAGRPNPAFQPTDPPGSLHQARNERWQRTHDHQHGPPHRPPGANKSTWGRIWGGVVKDYERARDSVAEPPRAHSPPPRRHSPPPRRHSPPPRRHSPPPRRSPPPPRRSPPPPRRSSPPPRRPSPVSQQEGGDNWAYGPTGRNKSTDSPFASAW